MLNDALSVGRCGICPIEKFVLSVRGVGFKRTVLLLLFMAKKQDLYLHKSSREYDSSKPIYACGEEVTHRPNLTDAQAMALKTCPKCFPEGLALKTKSRKVSKKKEGWL